jgi:thioredoxin reductase
VSDPVKEPSKGGHATLYSARLSDPRERAALPREAVRGRAVRRAEKTSDITRFRGVLAAAVAGAAAAGVAVVVTPPPGGLSSPGPLSRPHARAKLECAACHGAGEARAARDPGERLKIDSICSSCHGQHGSTRPGHQRALSSGQIGCATCHPIHRADQGVTFLPGAEPIRFAPGVELAGPAVSFHPLRPVTVPIVTAASCAGCHDVTSPRDPIARCLIEGQAALGGARPVACFEEHEVSYADDPAFVPGRRGGGSNTNKNRPRGDAGVCSGQHTEDRALAWEAAREVAVRMPVLPAPDVTSRPFSWIGAGLGASILAFGLVRIGHAVADRRKRKADEKTPEAMLRPQTRVRLPQVDVNTCLGCYACVDACPYDVLEIDRYVAVVARPEACCGLTLCEQRCPNGSLVITDGDPIGDRPRLGDALESLDVPGLYLAGDITGLPLIKNAIHQGAHAVTRISEDLARSKPARPAAAEGSPPLLDLLIIGAGPAGISAALRAKELDLAAEVVEQGSVAQSIQSFPRGKLVFDQPLELPATGKLWLKESTKEELLSHWLRIVRQERLVIHQDTRMTSIQKEGDVFLVTTEPREGGVPTVRRARRVLLAIGQRGSPRRLPFELDPDVEARVHYHLADARSFAKKRVIIVGLGDVAMETAIALARQPDTTVTVIHRRSGFTRGKTRNIDEVRRLAAAGRISIHFDAEITSLDRYRAVVKTPARPLELAYDAVLVMIGSIPPRALLAAAGVRTAADELSNAPNTPSPPEEPPPPVDVFRDAIA